ncbi:MAG: hypothetical protein NZM38_04945 [Cytophagales bacterium]|nr:hypothetical protein [Cytophagales bacterium]MDW8384099.1 hypothetical protein [Flammeovirgaceae bacterium]
MTSTHFFTFILVVTIMILIGLAHQQQIEEKDKLYLNCQRSQDSLSEAFAKQERLYLKERQKDSARIKQIRENKLNALGNPLFRVYGLFFDANKQYTISQIAYQFRINNISEIKYSDFPKERWFIVPVKGVHFVDSGETATTIARLYYRKLADSVLIKSFNKTITPGKYIFIPFE